MDAITLVNPNDHGAQPGNQQRLATNLRNHVLVVLVLGFPRGGEDEDEEEFRNTSFSPDTKYQVATWKLRISDATAAT